MGLGLGVVAGHGVSAKGAIEGALGGQWIPDVPNPQTGGSVKGVIEGALGGQWIPDVPLAPSPAVVPIAAPLAAAAIAAPLAVPALTAGIGAGPALGLVAGPSLGHGAGVLAGPALGLGAGLGLAEHGLSRGSIEGALGGQWIPDVPVHGAH